jgi:hypothetical protein
MGWAETVRARTNRATSTVSFRMVTFLLGGMVAKLTDEQQSDLLDEAWNMAWGVIMTGKITLPGGEERQATTHEIVGVMRDLMSKRAPVSNKVPNLDDLRLKTTDGK